MDALVGVIFVVFFFDVVVNAAGVNISIVRLCGRLSIFDHRNKSLFLSVQSNFLPPAYQPKIQDWIEQIEIDFYFYDRISTDDHKDERLKC
jgi:hypothetical protein